MIKTKYNKVLLDMIMDIEFLGFVQTAFIRKTHQDDMPVERNNIHLSIINEELDKNDWSEVYHIWNRINALPS